MASRFNNDPNRGPDLPHSPWWDWEDFRKRDWTPPTYQTPPNTPPAPGPLPWWVDPSIPQTPQAPGGPMPWWTPRLTPRPPSSPDALNEDGKGGPINANSGSQPISTAPAARAGGLLGMLYTVMQQGGSSPDGSVDSKSAQAVPERRLGRRTYRP